MCTRVNITTNNLIRSIKSKVETNPFCRQLREREKREKYLQRVSVMIVTMHRGRNFSQESFLSSKLDCCHEKQQFKIVCFLKNAGLHSHPRLKINIWLICMWQLAPSLEIWSVARNITLSFVKVRVRITSSFRKYGKWSIGRHRLADGF